MLSYKNNLEARDMQNSMQKNTIDRVPRYSHELFDFLLDSELFGINLFHLFCILDSHSDLSMNIAEKFIEYENIENKWSALSNTLKEFAPIINRSLPTKLLLAPREVDYSIPELFDLSCEVVSHDRAPNISEFGIEQADFIEVPKNLRQYPYLQLTIKLQLKDKIDPLLLDNILHAISYGRYSDVLAAIKGIQSDDPLVKDIVAALYSPNFEDMEREIRDKLKISERKYHKPGVALFNYSRLYDGMPIKEKLPEYYLFNYHKNNLLEIENDTLRLHRLDDEPLGERNMPAMEVSKLMNFKKFKLLCQTMVPENCDLYYYLQNNDGFVKMVMAATLLEELTGNNFNAEEMYAYIRMMTTGNRDIQIKHSDVESRDICELKNRSIKYLPDDLSMDKIECPDVMELYSKYRNSDLSLSKIALNEYMKHNVVCGN